MNEDHDHLPHRTGPAPGRPPDLAWAQDPLRVDCDRCLVRRPTACGDCVVSVLLGGPPEGVSIDPDEARALAALADVGLVPPLRLVTALDSGVDPGSATA